MNLAQPRDVANKRLVQVDKTTLHSRPTMPTLWFPDDGLLNSQADMVRVGANAHIGRDIRDISRYCLGRRIGRHCQETVQSPTAPRKAVYMNWNETGHSDVPFIDLNRGMLSAVPGRSYKLR